MKRRFKVLGAKFHSDVEFFVERWSFCLQAPIFLVVFGFLEAYSN